MIQVSYLVWVNDLNQNCIRLYSHDGIARGSILISTEPNPLIPQVKEKIISFFSKFDFF